MPAVGSTTPALGEGQISSGEVSETGALIDLILKRFHETHRREGPELSRLAARLEASHTGDANWPMGLAALTERIMGELVTHMAKEEIVVFPRMRRGGGAPLDRPLAVLHAEHGDNEKDMAILRQMTNAFTPPASAGPRLACALRRPGKICGRSRRAHPA